MTQHSQEYALNEQEFEQLWDATDELNGVFRAECRFILIVAGRLGLRAGEICHMEEHWVNWERSMIEIPRHEPCDCGYCRTQAAQSVEKRDDGTTLEEEMNERWKPKTSNSARAVPFDFTDRTKEAVEEFFFFHDRYIHSRSSVNRRVDRILETAGFPADKCFPHALRATAATYHAYRGVPAPALQSLFGWASLGTAMKYIRLSGGATANALRDAHSD